MERLTRKSWRNLDPWEMCGQDNYCKRGCHDQGGCTKGCIVPRIYARLAAYEETGLEPEEIKVHEAVKYNAGYYHGDEDRCRWIEKELGPIDHLRDLLQAEQEGRLVVLPCKVGDSIYIPDLEKKIPVKVRVQGISIPVSGRTILHFGVYPFECECGDGCGKDWFFTREEAEAAMAQEGGTYENSGGL